MKALKIIEYISKVLVMLNIALSIVAFHSFGLRFVIEFADELGYTDLQITIFEISFVVIYFYIGWLLIMVLGYVLFRKEENKSKRKRVMKKMSVENKMGCKSEVEFLREENSRLKLELEEIKYKIMKDDVEKRLDLYHYFVQHWNSDRYLSLVINGKFLRLFSEAFNVGRSQMIIDKYSYDDVVAVVKSFCEELTAKMVLKQEPEEYENENE